MLDFGISGRKALICASSRGLGYGCAEALAKCGARLVLNARDEEKLRIAGDSLRRKTGVQIECIAADITTVEGRNAVLEKAGSVDILVNNPGGPPKGHFKDWKRDDWIRRLMVSRFERPDALHRLLKTQIYPSNITLES